MGFISLKEDIAFKEFFANEEVLKQFIHEVLGIQKEKIRKVKIVSPFLRRSLKREKLGILDILVELNDDTKIDLEMQVEIQKFWHQRNLYYLSKMYTDDVKSGEDYTELRKCITVSILDFNLTDDPQCHSVYSLRDERGRQFSELFEVHIIELKKIPPEGDPLREWVRLFHAKSEEDLCRLEKESDRMQNAISVLRSMNLYQNWKWLHEYKLKYKRDQHAREAYVRDEGVEIGKEIGRQEGRQEGESLGENKALVRHVEGIMMNMNIDLETACKILGVDKQEYINAKG